MSAIDAGLIKTMEKCAPGHAPREPTVRADGRGVVGEAGAGAVQSVKYLELIPMFLNELQREHEARQQESAMLATLEAKLAALERLVATRLGQIVPQDGVGDSSH